MKTDIYILLIQNIVKFKGSEIAFPVSHENIALFPTIEKAFEVKDEVAETLKKMGYHVADSGPINDDPFVCYWSRYEADQDRAVAFTILRKTVKGDLFSY